MEKKFEPIRVKLLNPNDTGALALAEFWYDKHYDKEIGKYKKRYRLEFIKIMVSDGEIYRPIWLSASQAQQLHEFLTVVLLSHGHVEILEEDDE